MLDHVDLWDAFGQFLLYGAILAVYLLPLFPPLSVFHILFSIPAYRFALLSFHHVWPAPYVLRSDDFSSQAAPKYNYPAICAIYFLASIGLGGNIPIDATIALEFLPQNRRSLVTLLSLWQPIGVVAASGIAYGTAAKYRCDVTLPSCHAVAAGAPCCSVSSNMGWRYEVIILGCVTLLIFFLRYFVFTFHESPKFLISKGREQEAIDVLCRIAKFNRAPLPTLTVEHFAEVDAAASQYSGADEGPVTTGHVVRNFFRNFLHLKGLFLDKLQLLIFILLGLAYMVSFVTVERHG